MNTRLNSERGRKAVTLFQDGASDTEVASATGLKVSTATSYRSYWRLDTGQVPGYDAPPRLEADIRQDLKALLYAAFRRLPEEFQQAERGLPARRSA